MPKEYKELAQGNFFTRSSEGGASVDTAQKQFKVLLTSPNESWTVPSYIGIDIGDAYSTTDPIPCVSWEARHDGDSRMVMIVTFRYRSTPGGVDGSGSGAASSDPRLSPPASRPALYSLSSSLQEVPAVGVSVLTGTDTYTDLPALRNSAGDPVDGLTKLEPVVTLQITQYSLTDQTGLLQYTGYVNSDDFAFSGHTVPVHCCMFQSINCSPYVESGFRGFQLDFQFSFRWNFCTGVLYNGSDPLGWDQPIVNSGYNIINNGLNVSTVEQEHLVYELDDVGNIKNPKVLKGAGAKVRAQIPAAGVDGGERQHGAASPVLLDEQGRPLSRNSTPIVRRVQTQPAFAFGDNFVNFGINSFY